MASQGCVEANMIQSTSLDSSEEESAGFRTRRSAMTSPCKCLAILGICFLSSPGLPEEDLRI